MRVRVFPSYHELAAAVAERLAMLALQENKRGKPLVLGLASGTSPRGIYHALEKRMQTSELDLGRSPAFCLDEYYPIDPADPRSYRNQMSQLAKSLGISTAKLHIPHGNIPREEIARHCEQYEAKIRSVGGIDFQILGIGRSGHIGFNEPGSSIDSRTRLVSLHETTREDAAADFGGLPAVPREAITMGVSTILQAREIALVASGEHKAKIVRRVIEGPPTSAAPASFLQAHGFVTVYLEAEAAKLLRQSRCA